MAKKDKKKEVQTEEKTSGFKTFLIVLAAVLVFLLILIILIKMDLGGFGSGVLRPVLKDVPVVNKILPAASDAEVSKESGYSNMQEAVDKIHELESALKEAKQANSSDTLKEESSKKDSTISQLEKEIKRLKAYEKSQKDFQKQKNDFYEQVVYNDKAPDSSTYSQWYESMDKDTAAKIYREVVGNQQNDAQIQSAADTYKNMKPDQAAAVLQNMSGDLDTVVAILQKVDVAQRGKILGAMDSAFAAKITKKMMP